MNNQQNPIGQGMNPVRQQPAGQPVPTIRPLEPRPAPAAQPVPTVRPLEPRPAPTAQPVPTVPRPAPAPVERAPGGSPGEPPEQPVSKIQMFEQRLGAKRHEDNWSRSPNVTGTGAIHVKSFHCKLIGDSLEFLDQQINEWLDAHPQYEVKFVTSSIGEWTGKIREPNLIVQVWV